MNEKIKKYLIIVGIIIALCSASFCAGRFIRLRGASEDSIRLEQQFEQQQQRLEQLQSELDNRIRECDELREQLDRVELGIDESIRTARSIGDEIGASREQLTGSSEIIKELRKRFIQYEDRIAELEKNLGELKESVNK